MKKLVSLFLMLALLVGMASIPAMAEEQPTFTIAARKDSKDKSESAAVKAGAIHAEEVTGMKIEWVELEATTVSEKVNILLATGDLPDAFVGTIGMDQILNNLPLFLPLNDYLTPEIMPNYCAMIEKYPQLLDIITQLDGGIYSLPGGIYSNPDNQTDGIQFINKAWLDKLNLAMPTTTEEFYEVCKAIKAGDPNGNGVADELPVLFANSNWAAHFINLLGPWGICENMCNGYLKLENGKAIFTPTLPEFRAGLEYWHRMAEEGLLDIEGFTETNAQFSARVKEYVGMSFSAWLPTSHLDAEKSIEYVALLPLKASDYPDIKPVALGEVNRLNANACSMAITAACKDPETLLKWIDAQNVDVETKMLWRYGEEGKLWQKGEDGKIYKVLPEEAQDFDWIDMSYTYGYVDFIPGLVLPEELEQPAADASATATLRTNMVNQLKDHFATEFLPRRNVSAEKQEVRDMIYNDLKPYLDAFVADAVVNGLDDAKWESHLKTVEQYRASEWVQWYQDFVDGKF